MNKSHMKAGLFPAFFFLLFLAQGFAQPIQGIWVVRHSITTPAKVKRVVAFAEKNGYTDLFIQVRGRGDAYYASKLVPRSHLITQANYDPLADVVQQAHAKGIRVHAWVNMYLSWSARSLPKNSQHIVNAHPEWVEVNGRGKSDLEFVPQNGRQGREGVYLSPLNDEANTHLLRVIQEIVTHYDVDGIHMDYVRYQDRDYGYNRSGRKQFLMTYNVDPITLGNGKGSYWYRLDPADKEKYWILWNNFRRDQLTAFIDCIHKSIRLSKPDVRLSAAVKPNPEVAKTRFFQDWTTWLKQGSIDFVVPMNYATADHDFRHSMTLMHEAGLDRQQIYMGVATYNQNSRPSSGKVALARAAGFQHIVIFSYDTVEKDPRYFDLIHRRLRE